MHENERGKREKEHLQLLAYVHIYIYISILKNYAYKSSK